MSVTCETCGANHKAETLMSRACLHASQMFQIGRPGTASLLRELVDMINELEQERQKHLLILESKEK